MRIFSRKIPLCALLFLLLGIFLPARIMAMAELKVGYVPGTGFLEEDMPGHMRGNGYEYMEFLSGFLGAKFSYVPCVNWWEAGAKLENHEIDLLPAMPGNYKTLPFAVRTDHVIARFPMELVVQNDFAGGHVRLGTLDYNYPTPSLAKAAQEHGFSYELISFSDPLEMKQAFAARQLDGFVQPLLHPEKSERVLAIFDRVSYRLLVHRDRPELLAQVNAAQDSLLLNQPNIRNRLNDKYERAKGFPLVLSPAEKAYLQEKGTFHVAVLMRTKPYFYRDEEGNWAGATQALLNQLEQDLGITIELVEVNSLNELHRLLSRGTIDFVADVPCDFSWLDSLGLMPTQSYLEIGYVPVTRHGAQSSRPPKAAVVEGNFETAAFIMPQYPREQIISRNSWEECFAAVGSGLADVTYAPRATVPYLMEAVSAYNLSADTESIFLESVSLGVAKEANPLLWQILDKEINHLPPRLAAESLSQTAHENVHHLNPVYLLYHYPLQAALLIFLIMGSLAGIIYYRFRQQKRKLTAMEEKT
ncbi:MAG: transporter substrate-binding domain-containing protein [Selenomonas sp.]|nr:transporter substrate-binding domain-containing protein [Selenomonas sp.]